MGFLNSLFNSVGNSMLETQFGIRTPSDAPRAVERIIRSGADDDKKEKAVRYIMRWLESLSMKGDDRATNALKFLKNDYSVKHLLNEYDD